MFKKLLTVLLSLFTAAAFGAIDVNRATQADVESIKGIGPVISTKVVEERKKGAFKDRNDMVTRAKGIGEGNAAKMPGKPAAAASAAEAKASRAEKKEEKAERNKTSVQGADPRKTPASGPASSK